MMTSMTGKEILQEEFEKAGMRGYKAEQVDTFLKKVAAYVDELDSQNSDLTYKIKILADKIEEYKADEENIREALLGAQKLGTSILNEAKSKSESMVREAKNTYDTMMSQAKSNADFMTKETLQKANSDLQEIKRECERERVAFEKMKKEVSNFKASILKQYKTHLDLLSNLPSIPNSSTNSQQQYQPLQKMAQTQNAQATQATQVAQAKVDEIEQAKLDEEKAKASSYLPDIKPNYDDMGIKPAFFDQDANGSNYEKEIEKAKSAKPEPLEATMPKAQTLSSEILTNETELLDEEEGHTKEFDSDVQVTLGDSQIEENPAETTPDIQEDSQEKFKINMGPKHERPNYVEKFGELKFGGFGTENK